MFVGLLEYTRLVSIVGPQCSGAACLHDIRTDVCLSNESIVNTQLGNSCFLVTMIGQAMTKQNLGI